MLRQIGKRLVTTIPSIIGVIIVTFLLTRVLPGDPAAYFAGPAATPQAIEEFRTNARAGQVASRQFVAATSRALSRATLGQIAHVGPAGAQRHRLTAAGLRGTDAGRAYRVDADRGSARDRGRRQAGLTVDHICRMVATAGVSLPVFFTGLLLVYFFYYILGWSPAPLGRLDVFYSAPPHVTGFYLIDSLIAGELETFRASAAQLILPAATLAIFSLAPITRMTRASMLAVMSSDFVRTARASGLTPRTVIVTYAFRNAMLPVITTLGMVFSFLLGANVLVEKVFAWPGIGSYAIEALIASDFAPVQGFVLVMAIMYVALNPLDRHALRRDRPAREARRMNQRPDLDSAHIAATEPPTAAAAIAAPAVVVPRRRRNRPPYSRMRAT